MKLTTWYNSAFRLSSTDGDITVDILTIQGQRQNLFLNKGHFSPPRKDEDKRKFDKRKENICETTITLKSFDFFFK